MTRREQKQSRDKFDLILIGQDVMRSQNPTIKLTEKNKESDLDISHIQTNWEALPLATATTRHLATKDTNNLSQLSMICTVMFGFSTVTGGWIENRKRLEQQCAEGKVNYEEYALLRNEKFLIPAPDMPPFVKAEMESPVSQKIFRLKEGQPRSARVVVGNFLKYIRSFVSTTDKQIKAALASADFDYLAIAAEIASAPPTQQPTALLNPTAPGQQFEVETASVENGTQGQLQHDPQQGRDAAELQRFAELGVESADQLAQVFAKLGVKDIDELAQKSDVLLQKDDAKEELDRFYADSKEAAEAAPSERARDWALLDIEELKGKVWKLETTREVTLAEAKNLYIEILQTRLGEKRCDEELLQKRMVAERSAARRGEFFGSSSSKENRGGNEGGVSDGLEQGRGGAGAHADSNDLGSKRSDGGGEAL